MRVFSPATEFNGLIGFDREDAAAGWMIEQLLGAGAWAARPRAREGLRASTVAEVEANARMRDPGFVPVAGADDSAG